MEGQLLYYKYQLYVYINATSVLLAVKICFLASRRNKKMDDSLNIKPKFN